MGTARETKSRSKLAWTWTRANAVAESRSNKMSWEVPLASPKPHKIFHILFVIIQKNSEYALVGIWSASINVRDDESGPRRDW